MLSLNVVEYNTKIWGGGGIISSDHSTHCDDVEYREFI